MDDADLAQEREEAHPVALRAIPQASMVYASGAMMKPW